MKSLAYSLTDLLTQCDASAPRPEAELTWLSAAPVGLETDLGSPEWSGACDGANCLVPSVKPEA